MQDRLGDLRELAYQVNPTGAAQLRQGLSAALDALLLQGEGMFDIEVHMGLRRGEEGKEQFMSDVFHKLDVLKKGIAEIRSTMGRIKILKQEAAQATAPEQEKRISDELTKLLDESNKTVLNIKKGLERLKEENASFSAKNPNSSEARMRENLHAAVTRKFREMLKEYQTVQTAFKKEVKEKATRQVKIVFPEASEDEVGQMVSEGDAATAQAIRLRITGQTHESLQNALSDLQDKYRDIRRLEQSVTELHQMFVDLATLVDAQGELLDQIEFSVNSAKDYTERAEKELISTRKHQKAARKRMCWLSVCIVILATVVAVPVVVSLTNA